MLIRLDPDRQDPLFTQVADAVRAAVLRGDAAPGERLPPARDLATSLGVNMHTVLRAYGILRDEGVVEMRRGRGVSVGRRPPASIELDRAVAHLLDVARRHGLSRADVSAALDRASASAPPHEKEI